MILTYEFETILWFFFFKFLLLIQKNQFIGVICSWIGLYGSRLCVCWMQETLVCALDIWQKCIQSHLDCRQWQNDLIVVFFSSFLTILFTVWRLVPSMEMYCSKEWCVCICFTFPLFSDLCWLTHSTSDANHPLTALLQHLAVYY